MSTWSFLDYITEAHVCPVVIWYGTLGAEVQAEFDVVVDLLERTEDWDAQNKTRRKYKELTRRHAGLCELRFTLEGRKFRPIGIRDAAVRQFIFLGGCEKKGFFGTTEPPNAFDDALLLKQAYEQGRGTTRAHT